MRAWFVIGLISAAGASNRCADGLIDCRSFFTKCVQESDICDGVRDCTTGFDERACECSSDADCRQDEVCMLKTVGKGCMKKIACSPGFQAIGVSCFDVDECATLRHNCSDNEFCINREGSFECKCKFGFYYDAQSRQCVDIDECKSTHYCEPPGHCTNSQGSFQCTCPTDQFSMKHIVVRSDGSTYEQFRCTKNDSCEEEETCLSSTKQSFPINCIDGISCRCPRGYAFTAVNSSCEDVDECRDGTHNCGDRLLCENTVGGYRCSCPAGYREHVTATTQHPIAALDSETPKLSCVDINECEEDHHLCQFGCSNLQGSYECVCKAGYRQDYTKRICLPMGEASDMLISESGKFSVATMNLEEDNLVFEPMKGECNESASSMFSYHQSLHELYFVNIDHSAIIRLHTPEPCEIIISNRANISALELDWVYNNIYWADSDGLSVAQVNGTHSKKLFDFQKPITKMIVDPFNGWLTLLAYRETWRIGLDGTFESRIFNETEVISLAFDAEDVQVIAQTKSYIMICPESAISLELCRKLRYSARESRLLDAFGDFIIIEEQNQGNAKIVVLSKRSKKRIDLNSPLPDLGGRIVHEIKQPNGQNKCSSSCSRLCVNSPVVPRFACLCPDNMICQEMAVYGNLKMANDTDEITVSLFVLGGFVVSTLVGVACGIYGIVIQCRSPKKALSAPRVGESPAVEMASVEFRNDNSRIKLVNHEIPPDVVGTNFPISFSR